MIAIDLWAETIAASGPGAALTYRWLHEFHEDVPLDTRNRDRRAIQGRVDVGSERALETGIRSRRRALELESAYSQCVLEVELESNRVTRFRVREEAGDPSGPRHDECVLDLERCVD